MRKFIVVISAAVILGACGNDGSKKGTGNGEVANRTVLAYFIADNDPLNDLSPYMRSDFYEMMEGMSAVDDTKYNLLVYCETIDDLPRLIHLKKSKGRVVADTIYTYPEQNPLDKTVMTQVFETVIDEFPAKTYGLVLASHGEGWVPASISANGSRSFGDYRGTGINIPDLREVLEGFPHLGFVFFDACYMQAIEVAYELRNCTDYVVSSPSEIPGPGAPYQVVVPLMFADRQDVAIDIARGYYEYYKDEEGGYYLNGKLYDWIYGVSASVIKTSELETLALLTKSILANYVKEDEFVSVSSLFAYEGKNGKGYYYDFDGLISFLVNEESEYAAWRAAFDDLQPYFETTSTNYVYRNGGKMDMAGANGISIYVPRPNSNLKGFYHTLEWYRDGGWKEAGW